MDVEHLPFGIGFAAKILKHVAKYFWAVFSAPYKIQEIKDSVDKIKSSSEKPVSSDATYCINCDTRMKLEKIINHFTAWMKCPGCGAIFPKTINKTS